MTEENRVRYRLSVNPELNERMEQLAGKHGLHPQQMAYMCMGLGLNVFESLTVGFTEIVKRPELLASIMTATREQVEKESDQLHADAMTQ